MYNLEKGDIIIIPPNSMHRTLYKGSDDCERYLILFPENSISESVLKKYHSVFEGFQRPSKIVFQCQGQKSLSSLFEKMYDEITVSDNVTEDFAQLLLYELVFMIERYGIFVHRGIGIQPVLSSDIDRACCYIAEHYTEPLTLGDASKAAGLTATYFSKKFKKETGTSFIHYLTMVRLHQASKLLLTTEKYITQIALTCGFNSSSYFKDSFQKQFHMSPSEYRKQRT